MDATDGWEGEREGPSQLDVFSCIIMYYNGALNDIECEYSEISKYSWIILDQSILCNVKIKVCIRASVH